MRRGTLLAILALAAAREKPTSRAARRARKAWLNGTKPPTLNTFYFYVDRDDPKNTTVPSSITTMLHKAKAHVIAQTDWCQARRPRPGARLSYPGKKDKKISYMLSRQRYAEWLPTALNVTGCSTFSKKRGTGAGHGSRGHG